MCIYIHFLFVRTILSEAKNLITSTSVFQILRVAQDDTMIG